MNPGQTKSQEPCKKGDAPSPPLQPTIQGDPWCSRQVEMTANHLLGHCIPEFLPPKFPGQQNSGSLSQMLLLKSTRMFYIDMSSKAVHLRNLSSCFKKNLK